jgi:hypothetical protein
MEISIVGTEPMTTKRKKFDSLPEYLSWIRLPIRIFEFNSTPYQNIWVEFDSLPEYLNSIR